LPRSKRAQPGGRVKPPRAQRTCFFHMNRCAQGVPPGVSQVSPKHPPGVPKVSPGCPQGDPPQHCGAEHKIDVRVQGRRFRLQKRQSKAARAGFCIQIRRRGTHGPETQEGRSSETRRRPAGPASDKRCLSDTGPAAGGERRGALARRVVVSVYRNATPARPRFMVKPPGDRGGVQFPYTETAAPYCPVMGARPLRYRVRASEVRLISWK